MTRGTRRINNVTRVLTLSSIAALGCVNGPTDTPPEVATHHLVVIGEVRAESGRPVGSARMSVRFADTVPEERSISVIGNAETETDGSYRLRVETFEPEAPGDSIHFFVAALLRGTGGAAATTDSVLVTGVAVPLEVAPPVTIAPMIHLPH